MPTASGAFIGGRFSPRAQRRAIVEVAGILGTVPHEPLQCREKRAHIWMIHHSPWIRSTCTRKLGKLLFFTFARLSQATTSA